MWVITLCELESKLYFGKTDVPKNIKKTEKGSKSPQNGSNWKLVIEQNLEMKIYQSTLDDY